MMSGEDCGSSEEEYSEMYKLKEELYGMMKEIVIIAGIGSVEEEGIGGRGIESINLDFAGGELYSCFYYEQVRFVDSLGEDYEFDNDLNMIRKLVREIRERRDEFLGEIGNVVVGRAIGIFGRGVEVRDDKSGEVL